jgi:ribonuclease BN (tRNA processing enzyme)
MGHRASIRKDTSQDQSGDDIIEAEVNMNITFAGVGNSSTTRDYYQSSFVLEKDGEKLLVDCGTDARFSLGELGITNANVGTTFDAIYITHLHGDHCGGLEWLAFCHYFNLAKRRPYLILHESLVDDLEKMMHVGLNSLKDIKASLDTFFRVWPVKDYFFWEGLQFCAVKGQHVWANDVLMPMYGLNIVRYEEPDKPDLSIFYSGDTVVTAAGRAAMENASLIFHDCETSTWRKSGVHAHFEDLRSLPDSLKNKMWLYHYGENRDEFAATENGFMGWVEKGQVFEL